MGFGCRMPKENDGDTKNPDDVAELPVASGLTYDPDFFGEWGIKNAPCINRADAKMNGD